MDSTTFKAWYWSHEEEDERTIVNVGGRTQGGQSVHVFVYNFEPWVFVELPKGLDWNEGRAKRVFRGIVAFSGDKPPTCWAFSKKKLLHHAEEIDALFLAFAAPSHARSLEWRLRSYELRTYVRTFAPGELQVHEAAIDTVLKLTALRELKLSGWTKVRAPQASEKKTTADLELVADWKDLSPGVGTFVAPKYLAFDIECYSDNYNSKIPDPSVRKNVVFQISVVVGFLGAKERKTFLLSLGNPKDVAGCDVLRTFGKERDLLLGFSKLVAEEDPDIFVGYNVIKFDWNYLCVRAEILGVELQFLRIGRTKGEKATLTKSSWQSSAFGHQEFSYPECCGRTNVDVLLEVERNYKLPKYSLNAVSEKFLGRKKDDLDSRSLFQLYKVSTARDLAAADSFLPKGRCRGKALDFKRKYFPERGRPPEPIEVVTSNALEIVGAYCVKDSILTVDLAEKLNLWTTMEEMSNVANVPASYLHTRGQQIKVLSQVFREATKKGVVIPKKEPKDEKYQGALVIEAHQGDYEKVALFDFASLYPVLIMTFNICFTTFLKEDDPTPDSECHVLEWVDHTGCPHDEQKRKKAKDQVICQSNRFRFRKVTFSEEGEIQGEGILPRLERRLLAERKVFKEEMKRVGARLKMTRGQATEKEIEGYAKRGWEVLRKGGLSEKEELSEDVEYRVLNAKQLAVKASANSMYGVMGSKAGFLRFVPGAASVTAMGRKFVTLAAERIKKEFPFSKLVYGDTDSCLFHFEGRSVAESFACSEKASKVVSNYLKCHMAGVAEDYEVGGLPLAKAKSTDPGFTLLAKEDRDRVLAFESCLIDLEFESMFSRLLLVSKKNYIGQTINKNGEVTGKVIKGVVAVRRDNSPVLKRVFGGVVDGFLNGSSAGEVLGFVGDEVHKMFTMQAKPEDFVVTLGVKPTILYASSRDGVPIDSSGAKIEDCEGPLDKRLVYPNLPQVLLSLSILKRGGTIPANTRIEFLFVRNPEATLQGEKAEEYEYFIETKASLRHKIDFVHYLEKQFANPLIQLFGLKYWKQIVPYEDPTSAFEKEVGRESWAPEMRSLKRFSKKGGKAGEYLFKGVEAQVTFALGKKRTPKALVLKSILVLNRLCAWHGTKKRRSRGPWLRGPKLRVGAEVVLVGTEDRGKIVKRDDTKTHLTFDVEMEDEIWGRIPGLQRKDITTFVTKGDDFFKEMISARKAFATTMEELEEAASWGSSSSPGQTQA